MPTATILREDVPQRAGELLARRRVHQRGLQHRHQRSPEDDDLYEACRWDYGRFAKTFLPHWCPDEFNPLHLDYYERLRQRQGSRGHYDVTAAPRGHSKTTGCCLVSIVHDCVYELEPYTLYITNRDRDATNKIRDIKQELEGNAALLRVFGPQVGAQWISNDFTTLHGQRVRGASRNTQLRGTSERAQRPSKVFKDDVEHFLRVLNEEQRERTWAWLTNDILHLGEPRTNYEVFGTILHAQSMLQRLLTTPGWTTHFYQAVEAFPVETSIPLWQEWREMFLNLDNPQRVEESRAFFAAHEEEMLLGSRVLWPTRRPYRDLMESRLREGESSFWQELQNKPLGDQRHVFDMEHAAFCTITPQGIIRAGGTLVPWTDITDVAMAWDPVPDKRDVQGTDRAAAPVLAQDTSGYLYILDGYLDQETSTERQILAIVDLLWKWDCRLLGIETNGFASLLPANIREAISRRAQAEHTPEFDVQLPPINNVRSKVLRISSLEPLVNNGWLQFNKTLKAEMLQEFANFLPIADAGQDGFPDATEMAIRTIRRQWERRDIT